MPEAFSTANLVALPITSKELGRGGFFAPPTKIVLSNSPTTIGLISKLALVNLVCIRFSYLYYQNLGLDISMNLVLQG